MSKKLIIGIVCAVVLAAGIATAVVIGGKGKDDTKEVKKETTQEVNRDGQVKSFLTGEWVDAEIGTNRPVAVMTENTKEALPQYGITSAGIVLEAPVEGGITRLMTIYEDYKDLTQIGNVRSCRPYYAYFAAEFDAIYVHFGQSAQGLEVLNSGVVDNLSGLDGSINSTFYRTSEHAAPHNAYTSAEGIASGIEKKGYSTSYSDDYEGHYQFAEDDKEIDLKDGQDCQALSLYFFQNCPYFIYNADTKTYARYQFNDKQVDAIDGSQVEVTNIILQNVKNSLYEGTPYLNITVTGSGQGKYITHGKMVDITWQKEDDGITHYYLANTDEEITLNQGKTWVSYIQEEYAEDNSFYASVEEFENK